MAGPNYSSNSSGNFQNGGNTQNAFPPANQNSQTQNTGGNFQYPQNQVNPQQSDPLGAFPNPPQQSNSPFSGRRSASSFSSKQNTVQQPASPSPFPPAQPAQNAFPSQGNNGGGFSQQQPQNTFGNSADPFGPPPSIQSQPTNQFSQPPAQSNNPYGPPPASTNPYGPPSNQGAFSSPSPSQGGFPPAQSSADPFASQQNLYGPPPSTGPSRDPFAPSQDPFSSRGPSADPFGSPSGFGGGSAGVDPFGSGSSSSDPFGPPSRSSRLDPFAAPSSSKDPFGDFDDFDDPFGSPSSDPFGSSKSSLPSLSDPFAPKSKDKKDPFSSRLAKKKEEEKKKAEEEKKKKEQEEKEAEEKRQQNEKENQEAMANLMDSIENQNFGDDEEVVATSQEAGSGDSSKQEEIDLFSAADSFQDAAPMQDAVSPLVDTGEDPITAQQMLVGDDEKDELFGKEKLSGKQKLLITLIVVGAIGLVLGGGIWLFLQISGFDYSSSGSSDTTSTEQNSNTTDASDELDSDRDGLSDAREVELGTDPRNADTDGDGYLDGQEVEGGFNPLGQ